MDDILNLTTVFLSFIPLFLGILIFRKSNYGIKALIALVLVSVTCDLNIILDYTAESGMIFTRAYSFFEFELTSLFFFSIAQRKIVRHLIVVGMILFPALVFIDFRLAGDRNTFDNLVMVCESSVFVACSVGSFYRMMADMKYTSITATPEFWMASAILVYFGGAIFVFSSVNYASAISTELFELLWNLHSVLRIAYITLITVAFWKARKQYQ